MTITDLASFKSSREVTEAAVVARVKRKLAHEHESIRYGENPLHGGVGRVWMHTDSGNIVNGVIDDLEEYAREIGVLHPTEAMVPRA